VALVPEGVRRLVANKLDLAIATGAGEAAQFSDDDYARAGARLEASPEMLLGQADLVVKIHPVTATASLQQLFDMRCDHVGG
jgi:alanine dehydrogenase